MLVMPDIPPLLYIKSSQLGPTGVSNQIKKHERKKRLITISICFPD